jgi:hypothetical protein
MAHGLRSRYKAWTSVSQVWMENQTFKLEIIHLE